MEKYSHRERLEIILAGEKPDRFAASFWRHFFHMEHHAEGTAEAMLGFQKRFDWDFMKINPRADYHVEDWGLVQEFSGREFVKHTKTGFPVSTVEDWDNIQALDMSSKTLAEHLKMVSLIEKGSSPELPLLMTVFTPLAIAGRMVEDDNMLAGHIREHPDKIKRALRAITDTFVKFVAELRNAGADGLFYATTQWAASNLISWEEYQEFGVPYDQELIKAAGDDALNLFHICSGANFLTELAELDYSSKLYNWDCDDPTNLPIDKTADLLKGKVVVGGVDRNGWLLKSEPDEIKAQMKKITQANDPSRLIIGPGCSIPPEVPMENLQAICESL
jgi:uroporphyrinogen decarboxylase